MVVLRGLAHPRDASDSLTISRAHLVTITVTVHLTTERFSPHRLDN